MTECENEKMEAEFERIGLPEVPVFVVWSGGNKGNYLMRKNKWNKLEVFVCEYGDVNKSDIYFWANSVTFLVKEGDEHE